MVVVSCAKCVCSPCCCLARVKAHTRNFLAFFAHNFNAFRLSFFHMYMPCEHKDYYGKCSLHFATQRAIVEANTKTHNTTTTTRDSTIKCFMDLTWWITILILFCVPFIIKNINSLCELWMGNFSHLNGFGGSNRARRLTMRRKRLSIECNFALLDERRGMEKPFSGKMSLGSDQRISA